MSVAKKLMAIGRVVQKLAPKIALVDVQTNQLDPYLRMYHSRYQQFTVDDALCQCKVDDLVLIRAKEQVDRVDLIHEVAEVVVRAGQLKDPITGRRVVGDKEGIFYLEDLQRINRLLPDYRPQAGLEYNDERDLSCGIPQSVRDRS